MTKAKETGIQLHAAVQQALVTAPIAEKPVIETYQKIALQYNFPAIKTLVQAYDSGLWVKSSKKFDPEQLISQDRIYVKGKSGIVEAVMVESYLFGKYDHPKVKEACGEKNEYNVLISGKPLQKDQRYYLAIDNTTNLKMFIRPTNVVGKLEFQHCKSLNAARNDKDPKTRDLADKLVQFMIAKTAKAFNIKHNITPDQIRDALESITLDYGHYKLSEIYFVMKQLKMGRYGKIYERIDESVVMTAFDLYDQERFTLVEERGHLAHDKATSSEKQRAYTGFFDRLIKTNEKDKRNEIKDAAFRMADKMVNNYLVSQQHKEIRESKNESSFDKPIQKANGQSENRDNG